MSEIVALGEEALFRPAADTPWRRLDAPAPRVVGRGGRRALEIPPETLTALAAEAFRDTAFHVRPARNDALAAILADPEASPNDRFVAIGLLRNAMISAEGLLPMCQDTGTATVFGLKGEDVRTGADDVAALAAGVREAFARHALRYSQMIPRGMFDERNSGDNLPAQIEIGAAPGMEYRLLFIAKGGGSANRTALFQANPAILNEADLSAFLREKVNALGVSGCPPYRLAAAIGGTSPELNLKAVKLAAAGAMDGLPDAPGAGAALYRDRDWEARLLAMARASGWGAQFGGKYLAIEARVVRMARHAGSLPVGLGVSCSADRNALARISADGVFLEQLDHNPGRLTPALAAAGPTAARRIALAVPMAEILAQLRECRAGQAVLLSGPMVVARDLAHARIRERLRAGGALPDYFRNHPVYYAGPAKTPPGLPTGSFGPTTANRMDDYLDEFMALGGSLVTLAKGNRSQAAQDACRKYGGFYLGTIGGAGALMAKEHITASAVLDFADLGMEAVHRIEVRDLPAFVIYDHQGGRLYLT